MSRGDGFTIADVSVGLLRDVKMRRLRQRLPADEARATQLLYVALLLSSWEEGERLVAEDADSPEEATPERIAALQGVGLIDDEHRLPEEAWDLWYGPAADRRERKRVNADATNEKRAQKAAGASATLSDTQSATQSGTPTYPIRPIRSDHSSRRRPSPARAPAREADPRSMAEVFNDLGIEPPIAAKGREKA